MMGSDGFGNGMDNPQGWGKTTNPEAFTKEELDALNMNRVGGIMDCVRHSHGCRVWHAPEGCTCGAINTWFALHRLLATARKGVEDAERLAEATQIIQEWMQSDGEVWDAMRHYDARQRAKAFLGTTCSGRENGEANA